MLEPPLVSALSTYFKTKRDFANGIAFSGTSLGTLILPPFMRWSIDEYTIRGALLLVAGVWLQLVWAVALVRPFPDITEPNNVHKPTAKIPKHIVQDPSESSAEVIWATEKEHPDIKARYQCNALAQQPLDAKGLLARASQNAETTLPIPQSRRLQGQRSKGGSLTSRLSSAIHNYWILVKSAPMLLLLIGSVLMYGAYMSLLVMYPAHFDEIGFSKSNAAWLMSVVGLVELTSRPVTGYLCVKLSLNKFILVAVSGFLAGGVGLIITFTKTLWIWYIYMVFFGVFGGLFEAISFLLAINLAGVEKSASGVALISLAVGIGVSVFPVIAGKQSSITTWETHKVKLINL